MPVLFGSLGGVALGAGSDCCTSRHARSLTSLPLCLQEVELHLLACGHADLVLAPMCRSQHMHETIMDLLRGHLLASQ